MNKIKEIIDELTKEYFECFKKCDPDDRTMAWYQGCFDVLGKIQEKIINCDIK